jgi:hypothetical protein
MKWTCFIAHLNFAAKEIQHACSIIQGLAIHWNSVLFAHCWYGTPGSCVLAVFPLLAFMLFVFRREPQCPIRSAPMNTESLQSLLIVLVPCRSVWPEVYLNAARRVRNVREQQLALPISTVVNDIVHGRVQLRNPIQDLPVLLRGELLSYGWALKLIVDSDAWSAAIVWFLSGHFFPVCILSI